MQAQEMVERVTQTQERIEMVPLAFIEAGSNPRSYFDEQELAELVDSVKANGVLQPILLRPVSEEKFRVVAGERRFRAAKAAGLPDIPAVIRECSDAEAEAMALIENTQRADMSPTEEARSASLLLSKFNGNRDEVLARLGWTPSKLERRLALLNCTANVQTALDERKILLGHAELLAAAPQDKQDGVLEKIIGKNLSVSTVREGLAKIAQKLSSAPFDTAGCNGCSYNSSHQAALFSHSLSDGYCTYEVCFLQKCEALVKSIVDELSGEYPKVAIISSGDAEGVHVLADGPMGVGVEQAVACRSCGNFGATVSMVPGKVGEVEREMCHDPACLQKKVAARIKEEKAKTKAVAGSDNPEKTSEENAGKTDKPKAFASLVGSKVAEYRVKLWRKVAALEIKEVSETKGNNALSLLIVFALKNQLHRVSQESVEKVVGSELNKKIDVAAREAETADLELREFAIQEMVASVMESISEEYLVECLTFLAVDLTKHWKINAEFLDLLTKSQIESIATEIGLQKHVGKDWNKLMSQKKDEIVAAILGTKGFDFEGKIPEMMMYRKPETSS